MKPFKVFEEFVFELGSGSAKAYETWTKGGFKRDLAMGEETEVFFSTDSKMVFSIKMKNINKYLDVDFGLATEDYDRYTDSLNKGEMWRIMSTVKREVEEVYFNSDLIGIRYVPKAYDNLPGEMGKKRDTLYRLFINNIAEEMGWKVGYSTVMGIVFARLKL